MSTVIPDTKKRMTKLKLFKDLKYGKVYLRQSLIDFNQIDDMNKIYKKQKQKYKIRNQQVTINLQQFQHSDQEDNTLMSPIQRIQMYRKQRLNKRMNEKMIKGFKNKQISLSRMRLPKTSKMLQRFQNKYRNQMPISYKQQLKQSELNLQKIKRNDRAKFQIHTDTKQLYQSRFGQTALITLNEQQQQQKQHQQKKKQQKMNKKRFISLKTSLPQKQKQKFIYISLRQIMKGRQNEKQKKLIIDVKNLQNNLQNYLNQAIKKMKIKLDKQIQSTKYYQPNSPLKTKYQSAILYHNNQHHNDQQNNNKKIKKINHFNIQRSFTRSQENSKIMIDTMKNFYLTKHQKNQNFNHMVKNIQYDRPLTSSIRKRNYTVLGKQSLRPIQIYRDLSEQERRKIQSKNYQFYCKLIKKLQAFHQEQIPTTVFIIQQIKRIFQIQYIFTHAMFQELVEVVNMMDIDHKSQEILRQIANYVQYPISFQLGKNLGNNYQK